MKNEESKRQRQNFMYNVAWLRKHHGLSKKKMAGLLRIREETLTRLKRGGMPPKLSAEIILNIWDHFGIHPKDQFGQRLGEGEMI